jgi:hypothetical protein
MDFSMFGLMFLLVPLLIGAVALAMAFGAVRDLLRGSRLARSGQQAEGRVVSAQMHHSGSRDNRSSRLVETIEFTTDRGQTVRANPSVNDAVCSYFSEWRFTSVTQARHAPRRFRTHVETGTAPWHLF